MRRLALACAAGGAGFLLLAALAHAAAAPENATQGLALLAWCALPIAATAQLAASVARADPVSEPRSALDAVSLGAARQRAHAALSTTLAAAVGTVLALLLFLQLAGSLGSPALFDGTALGLPVEAGRVPLGGALTLLALVPVTVALAAALAVPGRESPSATAALPWGAALIAAGAAVSGYAAAVSGDAEANLPGVLAGVPSGVPAGWGLSLAGVMLASPGLAQAASRLLTLGSPGALRLLAGRSLQKDAARLGMQLGTVAVTLAALSVVVGLGTGGAGTAPFGALGALGAAVVLVAVGGAALTTAATLRTARTPVTRTLRELGASPRLLRRTRLVRAGALFAVFAPLTWLTALLLALPLPG
ncbi:hypothetical protein [Streptomyces spiramenti]|uniref:hypothetical protein n=1 Tax=Streptomyces spiramenti TaxID=2720606 RepID=UPI001FD7D3D5|nr:hypothetical protein [Streptomyces spiramenti]